MDSQSGWLWQFKVDNLTIGKTMKIERVHPLRTIKLVNLMPILHRDFDISCVQWKWKLCTGGTFKGG